MMAQINIRMDDAMKREAEALFDELGMNMSTAVNIFVKQALRQRGIPFDISVDPFWSKENQAELARLARAAEDGSAKWVLKTMAELEAMEDE